MSSFDVNLYFSGNIHAEEEKVLLMRDVYRLHTFAYPKHAREYLAAADKLGVRTRMIIDSGAFTAWTLGKPVQLSDLMAYNDDLLSRFGSRHELMFISLDVIPGEKGRRATAGDIAAAVDESYSNFIEMQQHYPNNYVLPVYHSGEDKRLRNAYLNRTDYLCLSMDQQMSERDRLEWAKRAIIPGFKYHGLAATGNKMVTHIPWTSVDSSSWLTVANMGSILWPVEGAFRTLAVSEDSPLRHDRGHHVNTITPVERQHVCDMLTRRGYDVDKLATDYSLRRMWNIEMWCDPPWRTNIQLPVDLFTQCS